MPAFVSTNCIRAKFAASMSAMYREEVPLYGELVEIVAAVNAATLDRDVDLASAFRKSGELDRLEAERHGAIRVGTGAELATLRRVFAVMGMYPVAYYDLSVAGVPVHSTAFRPINCEALQVNSFRVFTSLLRLDLIEDETLHRHAADILASRTLVSERAARILTQAERDSGLVQEDADEFVREVLETFRWHAYANVSLDTYRRLNNAHRLVADIVSFKGPHINHLTPRVLDIDAAQAEMVRRGIDAKGVIEGPPPRAVPILLRQTSFKALEEIITFSNRTSGASGKHTARFGEIEQRGIALTRVGRDLYDTCLADARGRGGSQDLDYEGRLVSAFKRFPDDLQELREGGFAFFRYAVTQAGHAALDAGLVAGADLEACIGAGWVVASPLLYEDFLPVSAAGIFQSNLGGKEQASYEARSSQVAFEDALGGPVLDPFELYAAIERQSVELVVETLDICFPARVHA